MFLVLAGVLKTLTAKQKCITSYNDREPAVITNDQEHSTEQITSKKKTKQKKAKKNQKKQEVQGPWLSA